MEIVSGLFGDIYRGKKVLVTGHTGFKGSWLSLWLTMMGATVVGYSLGIPTKPSHFELLQLKLKSYHGDVLNKKRLLYVIKKEKPIIVFHLAAQALVRESYKNPVKTFETNIVGTMNLLECCRKVKNVKVIINVTSDKCYRNNESGKAHHEVDPLGGDDPYSASKACSEIISNAYRKSFFSDNNILLANVRAGNVIGGGDWAKDRLIPDIVRAISKNKLVSIRNPKSTRPWQHVLEPLSGYLILGKKLLEGKKEYADDWNFGPSRNFPITVLEIIEKMQKNWPGINFEIIKNSTTLKEAHYLSLNSLKSRRKLKWRSVWNSNMTILKTADWYKNYYLKGHILSKENLVEYIKSIKDLRLSK